jgi:hypothetical protein
MDTSQTLVQLFMAVAVATTKDLCRIARTLHPDDGPTIAVKAIEAVDHEDVVLLVIAKCEAVEA